MNDFCHTNGKGVWWDVVHTYRNDWTVYYTDYISKVNFSKQGFTTKEDGIKFLQENYHLPLTFQSIKLYSIHYEPYNEMS